MIKIMSMKKKLFVIDTNASNISASLNQDNYESPIKDSRAPFVARGTSTL